jgi:hypothetical protein
MRASTVSILVSLAFAVAAHAQSTAFTYQGDLKNAGQPAAGLHDFRFVLYDSASGGAQVGSSQCVDNVSVIDGLFTVTIDCGQQFATPATRSLQIEVRPDTGLACTTTTGFTALSPRQALTATPFANHAKSAFALDAADGSPTNAVYVANDGRVGIGTQAPEACLHIFTGNVEPAPGEGVRIAGTALGNANVSYASFATAGDQALGYVGDGSTTDSNMYLTSYVGNIHLYTPFGAVLTATSGGNIGIGTVIPAAKLDVRGDIRLGASGQFFAPAAEENLRVLRGMIQSTGTVLAGLGWTVTHPSTGEYIVRFGTPFSSVPTITASVGNAGFSIIPNTTASTATTQVTFFTRRIDGLLADSSISFIAAGPR